MASKDDSVKAILPFLQRADELQKHDPRVAYYCRLYAMEKGLSIPSKERSKDVNGLLISLMNQLEKDKKVIKANSDDNLYLEGFALNVFAKADKQDRAGKADIATAKTFYAASIFIEILRQFGELAPDIEEKQKYAVWKAADIRKCLSEGRKPVPGPPNEEEDVEAEEEGLLAELKAISAPSSKPAPTQSAAELGPPPSLLNLPSVPQSSPSPSISNDNNINKTDKLQSTISVPSTLSTTPLPPYSNPRPSSTPYVPFASSSAPNKDLSLYNLPSVPSGQPFKDQPHTPFQGYPNPPTSIPPTNLPPSNVPPQGYFSTASPNTYVTPQYTPASTPNPSTASIYIPPNLHPQIKPSLPPSAPSPLNNLTYSQQPPSVTPAPPNFPPQTKQNPPPSFPSTPSVAPVHLQQPPAATPTPSKPQIPHPPLDLAAISNLVNKDYGNLTFRPTPDKVAEAQKAAKLAVSALAFDDIPAAIDYLQRSLKLCTQP